MILLSPSQLYWVESWEFLWGKADLAHNDRSTIVLIHVHVATTFLYDERVDHTCHHTFRITDTVYRVVWVLKALWIVLSETINISRKLHKTNIFGMPPKMNLDLLFKLILRRFEVVSDVWSENAALPEILMEIHSNPPVLYYGFHFGISCMHDIKLLGLWQQFY